MLWAVLFYIVSVPRFSELCVTFLHSQNLWSLCPHMWDTYSPCVVLYGFAYSEMWFVCQSVIDLGLEVWSTILFSGYYGDKYCNCQLQCLCKKIFSIWMTRIGCFNQWNIPRSIIVLQFGFCNATPQSSNYMSCMGMIHFCSIWYLCALQENSVQRSPGHCTWAVF
jgi:hypothetical protein